MVRLKALVVVGEEVEVYGDLLAIGRAESKRMLKTHENANVKDICMLRQTRSTHHGSSNTRINYG
jgi:hypothetical protein